MTPHPFVHSGALHLATFRCVCSTNIWVRCTTIVPTFLRSFEPSFFRPTVPYCFYCGYKSINHAEGVVAISYVRSTTMNAATRRSPSYFRPIVTYCPYCGSVPFVCSSHREVVQSCHRAIVPTCQIFTFFLKIYHTVTFYFNNNSLNWLPITN